MRTASRNLILKTALCLFVLMSSLGGTSQAAERFPRPIFTPDRVFLLSTFSLATSLKDPESPFEIIFFERAQQSCQLSGEQALQQLRTLLREDSALWRTLDRVFPGSRQRLSERKVTLVLDDYTEFAGPTPEFSSYFIHLESQPVVSLNCAPGFRDYWLPSLTHELTHALFSGTNAESWWEEGIAQNLEEDIGGKQPSLTLKHLKNEFPSLLEKRRPLPSKESYALNQLLVRYLRQQFGGWDILRVMSQNGPAACETASDFLTQITCRGRIFLESSFTFSNSLLSPDKMTPAGLLRYFAVATTLNDKNTRSYNVPSWQGVELLEKPRLQNLEPGQFMAWRSHQILPDNPKLELYRVLSDSEGQFVILSQAQMKDPSSIALAQQKLKNPRKDFLLLLNTTTQSEPVNWLRGFQKWLH